MVSAVLLASGKMRFLRIMVVVIALELVSLVMSVTGAGEQIVRTLAHS